MQPSWRVRREEERRGGEQRAEERRKERGERRDERREEREERERRAQPTISGGYAQANPSPAKLPQIEIVFPFGADI